MMLRGASFPNRVQAENPANSYTQEYVGPVEYRGSTIEAVYHPEGRFNYEDGEIDRAEYAIRDHLDERTISGLSQNEQLGTVQVSEPLAAAAAGLMVTEPQFVNATDDRLVRSKLNGS